MKIDLSDKSLKELKKLKREQRKIHKARIELIKQLDGEIKSRQLRLDKK